MALIDRLSVILSDALPQLRLYEPADAPRLPGLEALLRMSELGLRWRPEHLNCARIDPWQLGLLHALDLQSNPDAWASAALSWRAEGAARVETCLHAEAVHLAAGLDSLRLVPISDVTAADAERLYADLPAALATAELELRQGPSGNWYAVGAAPWELTTYSPRSGFAAQLYEIMPKGRDGSRLRRLMTEVQMLLHEHPTNGARERRGQSAVNALWFWGAGHLHEVAEQVSRACVFGEQAYVRGLCDYFKIECKVLPAGGEGLLAECAAHSVAVIAPMALPELDARWLQPLAQAVARGSVRRLEIVLDHQQLTIRGDVWSRLKKQFKSSGPGLRELLA